MSTHPWLQSGLLCDTRQPDTPCVCKQEFPVLISIVAGIEILLFVWLVWKNPLVNAKARAILEKRSWAVYARWIGFITYFILYMTAIVCMGLSNERCSVAMYFFTLISCFFRCLLMIHFMWFSERFGDYDPVDL
jgi:hypothetical protein